jgi:hypothetical protein
MKAKVDRSDRRLKVYRFGELFQRALKAKALHWQPGHLLGQVKEFLGGRVDLEQVITHAHVLRSLSGEKKCHSTHTSPLLVCGKRGSGFKTLDQGVHR